MSSLASTAKKTKPIYTSQFFQIILATIIGIILGCAAPSFAVNLKPLSDFFLKLITMIVSPLVFCVVVQGIAGAGNLRTVGRIGFKALIYFEAMTTIALAFGLLMAFLFNPGHGIHINAADLDPSALGKFSDNAESLRHGGISAFFLNIVPSSPIGAFAHNDVLQILFFAILFGSSLTLIGESGKAVTQLIDATTTLMFRIMRIIVRIAPLGVLGAISFTVGQYGIETLRQLVSLVMVYFLSVAIFVIVCLGIVLRLCGVRLFKLLSYLREELLVVVATTSSDAVLPQIMSKLRNMGVKKEVVGLVIPAGYSFNLDALSIYLGLTVIFLAQATGTHLSWTQIGLVLGTALITSKGAHGVPGVAIVILAATLSVVPSVPAIGLVLVISVDWFIGIARAVGNIIGNCVATVVVAAWEKDLDLKKAQETLGMPAS